MNLPELLYLLVLKDQAEVSHSGADFSITGAWGSRVLLIGEYDDLTATLIRAGIKYRIKYG